ncbi:conserved hypothetical protein [Histoplasma capsulatum var. duboisii H88]|uniref:Uncharacterized protein n=2 Tax=Ajellomyces capsulatus TaxID=5037 RepID=F0UGX7_AJEC8|nr:conserved hypothetical protein [Histoplasma capsulatum H143]EGC44376.1 conserved hypothetical protein [Histoplasma capsulatum var. duboisii H88]
MVLPRSTLFRTLFTAQQSTRIAGARVSSRVWQQATRRTYASGGGESKKSSDLPWIIGSLVFTVPAASFLLADGPKKPTHSELHMPTHKDTEEVHISEKQAASEVEEEGEKDKTEPERDSAPSPKESDQSVRGGQGEAKEALEETSASESTKDAEDASAKKMESEKKETAEKETPTQKRPEKDEAKPSHASSADTSAAK